VLSAQSLIARPAQERCPLLARSRLRPLTSRHPATTAIIAAASKVTAGEITGHDPECETDSDDHHDPLSQVQPLASDRGASLARVISSG